MRHLHLIIQPQPDFLPDAPGPMRSLDRMLRRGRPLPVPAGLSEACCQALGVERQQDWPVAPLTARAAGLDAGKGYWLRLDPVHLDVGMHGLFLRAGLSLDRTEAATLHTLVAPILAESGLESFSGPDGVVHVRSGATPDLSTVPLDQVEGRQPMYFLPTGSDAPAWNRMLHEIQMVLHEHPLNLDRMAAGKLPVNSLWPWGGGRLVTHHAQMGAVYGESPVLRQLSTALRIPLHACPPGLSGVQGPGIKRALILLDGQREEWGAQDVLSQAWERDWLAPLVKALRLGRLGSVQLTLLGQEAVSRALAPWDMWRIWV